MGYKKSCFGRIEAHEAITAFGREILLKAAEIAEEQGFEVIHGIVDSLWIKKEDISKKEVQEYCNKITEKLGIELEIEGIYRWIVFPPSIQNRYIPAPNRYYGVFQDRKIKCRGIELRRRDCPPLVKKFQEKAIEILAKARNEKEFKEKIPQCIALWKKYCQALMDKEIETKELVIRKRISKNLDEYKCEGPQKQVLRKLSQKGYAKQPGDNIEYVIGKRNYHPMQDKEKEYDPKEYKKLLSRALESLLLGYGYDRQNLEKTQSRLRQFL